MEKITKGHYVVLPRYTNMDGHLLDLSRGAPTFTHYVSGGNGNPPIVQEMMVVWVEEAKETEQKEG